MIHELRIYRCAPGRLPALLNRFETITLKLWERHGIRQAGFWTTLIGDSNHDLTYLLQSGGAAVPLGVERSSQLRQLNFRREYDFNGSGALLIFNS